MRSGVRHREFSAALKPVFLKAAAEEAARTGGKGTDSALSLLSGLHRKDVRALLPCLDEPDPAAGLGKPTPASQVTTRWLTSGLPDSLLTEGAAPSFKALVRQVSSDLHPRSVLQELLRLGVVDESDGQVNLRRPAGISASGWVCFVIPHPCSRSQRGRAVSRRRTRSFPSESV